jgi:hypothetical protein
VYVRNGFEPVDENRFQADLLQTSFPYPSHIEFARADPVADAR